MHDISPQLLDILVCPENHTRVTLAEPSLLDRLNRAIKAGQIANRSGEKVVEPLTAGLVREDRAILYAIHDGIPIMLIDESISLEQIGV